jgi:hypothetical protein
MKKITTIISVVFLLAGCAVLDKSSKTTVKESSPPTKTASKAVVNPKSAIRIQSSIPLKTGNKIAANIKAECDLGKRLSDSLGAFAVKQGIEIIKQSAIDTGAQGKTLYVEITDAVSGGNAFIGHRKFTSAAGTLYNNGKKQAEFTAARISGGGFFGGYMGSCTVLGRTTKIIGRDIINWLVNPVDGAHLGDRI